jgi:hypothetical protein
MKSNYAEFFRVQRFRDAKLCSNRNRFTVQIWPDYGYKLFNQLHCRRNTEGCNPRKYVDNGNTLRAVTIGDTTSPVPGKLPETMAIPGFIPQPMSYDRSCGGQTIKARLQASVMNYVSRIFACAVLAALLPVCTFGVRAEPISDAIPFPAPRFEVRLEPSILIPMRDSVRLSTDIYFPTGVNTKLPVILIRTQYNKRL